MNSMTGFGRSEVNRDGRRLTIELKSVNHRFLDLNIRMPRTLLFLEDELRGVIKGRIARGHIDAYVNFAVTGESDKKITADIGLIDAYVSELRAARTRVKLRDDLALSHVMRIPDAVRVDEAAEDEELLHSLLLECAQAAVEQLSDSREREGGKLKADMCARVGKLLESVEFIESREQIVLDEYREKLKARVAEYSGAEIDETRLAQELLLYADRQNITEETVRVRTHVASFLKLAEGSEPAGRQLDFIVQELNREFNTMGSKSADIEITNAVISGKSEIEKIREQVQNIE